MKQLIENYRQVEQYCLRKQNELKSVPDLYDESKVDHQGDQVYQKLITNINQQYQQHHPLIIKEMLRQEFFKYCSLQQDNYPGLELQQYQLTSQQVLQYLLSILNFILKNDANQKLLFYSNPQIKIKCLPQESKFYKTNKNQLDLKKFSSYVIQFIHYLFNPIIFNTETIQIIQKLIEYKQPAQEQFQNSIRKLYIELIQQLDLEQYLKEELLYEIRSKDSPFLYKLQNCNYSICFNDNRLNDPNGPGFLPVLQKIRGYKGFGNLYMINARKDEWQQAIIHNCKYEMMLIYKKLSKASSYLFQQRMQFRYISNHQIIKYYQSYRILFHNLEKSTFNKYIDHYRKFLYLYEQFLIENQLDLTIVEQFKQLINKKSKQITTFVEDLEQSADLAIKQIKNLQRLQKQQTQQQEIDDLKNKIIQESLIIMKKNLNKIIQAIPEQLQESINIIFQQQLEKNHSSIQIQLEKIKAIIFQQLEAEIIEEIISQLGYFNLSNFKIKLLKQGSQSLIYCCEHLETQRKFAYGEPFQNYDFSELKVNIQKVQAQITKKKRKRICKIFKIDQNQMWMEYSNFGSLSNYINQNKWLHYFEQILICQQISQIIFQLHNANIYHLDVKLDNFLVFKKYGLYRIKICDFGSMSDEKEFQFNINKHRMLHAPPEAKIIQKIKSDKFDIWQLGNVFKSILKNLDKKIQKPKFFDDLFILNPEQRSTIQQVIQSIEEYCIYIVQENMYDKLVNENLQNYHNQYLKQSEQLSNSQCKCIYYKFNQIRKDDKQHFNLLFSTHKYNNDFLLNNNYVIYDILLSSNNWTCVYLFRQQKQIQKSTNQQFWSVQQKILLLFKIINELNLKNYFQSDSKQQDDYMFRNYAEDLRLLLENDNYEIEKDYNIKVNIFQSLAIDLFSQVYKQNQIIKELREIVKKIFHKKYIISNKNSYLGNIESALYRMLDLSQQLKFKNQNTVRIYGFLYLVCENDQKIYLQITKESANQGLENGYLELIQNNFNQSVIIKFKKLKQEEYQLFKLDFNIKLPLFIKFVAHQTILSYQGQYILDSPFNFIEGVFIDKRNNKFIKNDLYLPNKDLDDKINFIKYVTQILYQQFLIIGSSSFNQKLIERYKVLIKDSNVEQDQNIQQIERIFFQLLLNMHQLRNILEIKKQLELLYFIQDYWNSDIINLTLVCNNLKDNKNYIEQNGMNHSNDKYQIINQINQNSRFEYYISIENLQNASKLYQAFISQQLLKVIFYQQKQFSVLESNQKRILIDYVEFSKRTQYINSINNDQINQDILKYNVYLEIQSKELNEVCQQFKNYSLFDWINMITSLLNQFDVYAYYQYLKIKFGRDIIIKLLIFIKYYNLFQFQNQNELQDMIILFKQYHEYQYLQRLLQIIKGLYGDSILIISKNILQLKIKILNIQSSNFAFFNYQMQFQQYDEKQLNLIAYLSYFFFVNEQYYENLFYDLDEEKIYLNKKMNSCFHIKYNLFFQDYKLNKTLQYQFIISLLKNFQFYAGQNQEKQLNYIINQYNFQIRLEQKGIQIIQRLNYVIPQRIYLIKYKENLNQQYLCCYNFEQVYLNYDNFQITRNLNPFDYHCQSIVKLEGEIIRLTQITKSKIYILRQIITKMKEAAEILYSQGFEYEILESNIVIVINQSYIKVYPVSTKKVQNSLNDVNKRIYEFEQMIEQKIDRQVQKLALIQNKIQLQN